MNKATTITQKGQVTIPAEIRKELSLKTGDKIIFYKENDEIKLKPRVKIANLMGSIKTGKKYNKSNVNKALDRYFYKRRLKKVKRNGQTHRR